MISAAGLNPDMPIQGPARASDVSRAGLNTDFEKFLKLLVSQIQNQDPLEPMDSTTFVSQLAQLSQVEQAIETNRNLETIMDRLESAGSFSDVGLIGRNVRLESDSLKLTGGEARFSYSLDRYAPMVEIEILGSGNETVKRFQHTNIESGNPQMILWNGADEAGIRRPDGTYKIRVTAVDRDSTPVNAAIESVATVREVRIVNGVTSLQLDTGENVPSSAIKSVF